MMAEQVLWLFVDLIPQRDQSTLTSTRLKQKSTTTMGKKSKTKAKAGGGGSTKATPSLASSSTGRSPVDGVSTSGGGSSKQNKLKCIRCLAKIKDADKANACLGCSDIYCWRCERKDFDDCWNGGGKGCICPMRRCSQCRSGRTLDDLCEKAGLAKERVNLCRLDTNKLQEVLGGDFRLDVLPIRICNADGCAARECYRCAISAERATGLHVCSLCFKVQCRVCVKEHARTEGAKAVLAVREKAKDGLPLLSSDIFSATAALRSATPDSMLYCESCKAMVCYECIDDIHLQSFVKAGAEMKSKGVDKKTIPVRCLACYYKAKPCTNPDCPNEVGVPTKRCGGCHIDRYCSVGCQAVMYPTHVERCRKIQMKRDERCAGHEKAAAESSD